MESTPHRFPLDPDQSFNVPTVLSPRQRFLAASTQHPGAGDSGETEVAGVARAPFGSRLVGTRPQDRTFTLDQKIGEGGCGEVWEGQQCALNRKVAIKRLRHAPLNLGQGLPDDPHWLEICFRQEAFTAARLEHPNIVPIHDFGTDSSGTPIIAMKLVKGRPWNDLIHEDFSRLTPDAFLARHLPHLIAVGNAVDFAHSQGIVHRDLKPAQVMIGHYGEVQLMDWGLAMAYEPEGALISSLAPGDDPDSPLYNPVNPAGTPQFMAPEQTEDHPGNLGPWTDVYLLGGILFLLLSGRGPHKAPTGSKAFRMAKRGEILPLELPGVKREIPADLAALALEALQADPNRRVPSARDFVRRLEEHLSGAGRKRESVSLCTAVAETLSEAAEYGPLSDLLNHCDRALILWPGNPQASTLRQQVLQKYVEAALAAGDLKLARVQAERLEGGPHREEILQRVEGLEARQRAADERLRAALEKSEAMRARAEHILRFLIGDLFQNLEALGRLDILEQASLEALDYFDSLGPEELGATASHDLTAALLNISQVFNAQGRKSEALETALKALSLATSAFETAPDSHMARADVANALDRCGTYEYLIGKTAESRARHEQALAHREWLISHAPIRPDYRLEKCHTLQRLAVCAWRQRDHGLAQELFMQVLQGVGPYLNDRAHAVQATTLAFWTCNWFANVRRDQDLLEEAIALTDSARAYGEKLVDLQPQNRLRRKDLLWTEQNRAAILRLAGRARESLEAFEATIAPARALHSEDHRNVEFLQPLVFSLSHVALMRYENELFEDALPIIDETIELSYDLAALDPESPMIQIGRFYPLKCAAEILVCQGRHDAASIRVQEARKVAEEVLRRVPGHHIGKWALSAVLLLEAAMEFLRGQPCPDRAAVAALAAKARAELPDPPGPEGLNLVVLAAVLAGTGEDMTAEARTVSARHGFSPLFRRVLGLAAPGLPVTRVAKI